MAMKLKASAMHRHELKTRGSRGLNKEVNHYIMVEKPTKFLKLRRFDGSPNSQQ